MSFRGWGTDWDSKWRFSIDPWTKCHFILGARGGRWVSDGEGGFAPATNLTAKPIHIIIHWFP